MQVNETVIFNVVVFDFCIENNVVTADFVVYSSRLVLVYTVFHKKELLFVSFIIHSNDDQFT